MDTGSRHILGSFEAALKSLRDDVLVMGGLSVRNLGNAMRGLLQRDDQLCRLAIADDEEVDDLEKRIDQDGFQLILRFQPVASDLRAVIAAMKTSTHLERLGDLAVSIARRARRLNLVEPLPETSSIEPLFQSAVQMIRDSLRAFADKDAALAVAVKERDRELDLAVAATTERFILAMESGGPLVSAYLNLIMVARHIERAGDHAKNVGEDTVFAAAAEDIRHTLRPPGGAA